MSASQTSVILWFRHDLRLTDNPALEAALRARRPLLPVYIWSPEEERSWAPGGASRWWLQRSLRQLDRSLRALGSRLVLRRGPALLTLRALASEASARAIYWNRRYEPSSTIRDAAVKTALCDDGLEVQSFNAALLIEPWTVKTKNGQPFRVFTPFWKACLDTVGAEPPLSAPTRFPPLPDVGTESLSAFGLEPTIDWAAGLRETWIPGEAGAQARLEDFLEGALPSYGAARNRPDGRGTSRLSPHLHFGEIGPRQVWHAIRRRADGWGAFGAAEAYLRQLGWREFAHHLLFHFPTTPETPLRTEFDTFPWAADRSALGAWQRGRTGYPIVDAGMRELWRTGWMHNRVRMIAASMLVKNLLIPWQEGAAWFWDTLVDADLANNTLGWQWTSGCGADAAPYFRVFNPVLQGEKFDPDGLYVRRWVPALAKMPSAWIHRPWEAPESVLTSAGLRLGVTYPRPIVDHAEARRRALAAFSAIRSVSRS